MLIAQLTDTHITRAGRQSADLAAALDYINTALPRRPDVIVISGDVADTGTSEQYAIVRDVVAASAVRVLIVPGNHDRNAAFRAVLPSAHFPNARSDRVTFVVDDYPVRIVGLATAEYGRPGAVLDGPSLDWLETTLAHDDGRPVLICMHHPPFRTGVTLADVFGFRGVRRFRQIVADRPWVRRIVCGHVHCRREATIAQALVTSSISSTPQLVPELFERRLIGLRPEPAGFALHAWEHERFHTTTYVQTNTRTNAASFRAIDDVR